MLFKVLKIAPLLLGAFGVNTPKYRTNNGTENGETNYSIGFDSTSYYSGTDANYNLNYGYYTNAITYGDSNGTITARFFSASIIYTNRDIDYFLTGDYKTSLLAYIKIETPKNMKTSVDWKITAMGQDTDNRNDLPSTGKIYQSINTNLESVFTNNIYTWASGTTNFGKTITDNMLGYQYSINYAELLTANYTEDPDIEDVLYNVGTNPTLNLDQIYNYTNYYLLTIEPNINAGMIQAGSYNYLYDSISLNLTIHNTPIPSQNMEVVNVPGLMFDVLTMPFTFVSIAFNLTLFPGTPYQLNLSALFLAILGVLIFAFILKTIINKS